MTPEVLSQIRSAAAQRLNNPHSGKIEKNVSRQLIQVCDYALSLLKK